MPFVNFFTKNRVFFLAKYKKAHEADKSCFFSFFLYTTLPYMHSSFLPSQSLSAYRYCVVTLGCQMNKNDSERLESVLKGMGFSGTEDPKDADVIVLNSCSVRKSAEDRIFGLSREFARLKKTKPELLICVTGCMPGRDRDGSLRKKLPHVDLFFSTKDMILLPQRLSELNPALRPSYQKTFQAFVTIQTGCNHFCTYCVVPFSRGMEVNRPLKDIIHEVEALSTRGCIEITLLGQIVNHYRASDPHYFSSNNPYHHNDFAKLLWEVGRISGIQRVHWTAPHPLYMDEEVIDALGLPNQVQYLHLPVQSGNDEILKRMNRRHTRAFYLDTINNIRIAYPRIAIGTDIIVGFSGETDAQFYDTVTLYRACDFDISYTAQYSERSHTVAAKAFSDSVSKEEKKRRWETLQTIMEQTVLKKNQAYVGQTVSVLVDQHAHGFCLGNSSEMKRVRFHGEASQVGTIQPVEIFQAEEWILHGRQKK